MGEIERLRTDREREEQRETDRDSDKETETEREWPISHDHIAASHDSSVMGSLIS